ncbi:MAG: hypothetical protein IKS03_01410 [Ruminococcus sp.]|nr:hypothetical protein [Ruminococcus sp.]
MSIFGNKKRADRLETQNAILANRVAELENLCQKKDKAALEIISDGLRHGSSIAGQEMAARKKYLKEKNK